MNRKNILSCLVILMFAGTTAYCISPEQRWVARYNSPFNNGDYTRAIAVDQWGNVYVTGQSYQYGAVRWDCLTIKYSANGQQLWTATHNGSGNNDDWGMVITVDNVGNSYVGGGSAENGTGWDYITIKYDPNGNEVWARTYDGPLSQNEELFAIAVDGLGNVYVTGSSPGEKDGIFSPDYATVKYDPNGNQLWAARYGGGDFFESKAYGLTIDNKNNVIVTGSAERKLTTIKYDANGNELWVAQPLNQNKIFDEGRVIVTDIFGNIYVAGKCMDTIAGISAYAILKYDPNGNQLWLRTYSGLAGANVCDLVIDQMANVYVTGESWDDYESWNYATVKYDTSGNVMWTRTYDGGGEHSSDEPSAIAVDSVGNVYVTGSSWPWYSAADFLTIAYTTAGDEKWVARYSTNESEIAHDITVDNLGNLYVTGEMNWETPALDCITIKYTEHGYCTSGIAGDLDNNCKVDLLDAAIFAESWPGESDFTDLANLVEHWLECNFALEGDCWQ